MADLVYDSMVGVGFDLKNDRAMWWVAGKGWANRGIPKRMQDILTASIIKPLNSRAAENEALAKAGYELAAESVATSPNDCLNHLWIYQNPKDEYNPGHYYFQLQISDLPIVCFFVSDLDWPAFLVDKMLNVDWALNSL